MGTKVYCSLVRLSRKCYFSSDLVYVIIFPQLLLVVHFEEYINARGSQLGFFVGLLVRISGGESKLKIPPLIKYPGYGTDLRN